MTSRPSFSDVLSAGGNDRCSHLSAGFIATYNNIQNRHLIPATVDRTSASAWLYKTPWIACPKNKLSTSMTHVAGESELRSVVRSSMLPCPGNWVAIRPAVVYHARAAQAFSAGIKCQHCSLQAIHFPQSCVYKVSTV